MPKLKDLRIREVSQTGEVLEISCPLNVSGEGVFSAAIPEQPGDLVEIARKIHFADDVQATLSRGASRLTGPTLKAVETAKRSLVKAYLACDVQIEDVIVYSQETAAAYVTAPDGRIFPNGHIAEKDGGVDFRAGGAAWHGSLNGSNGAYHYSFKFYARAVRKTTYTRASGTKVVYSDIEPLDGTYAARLNAFVGLYPPWGSFGQRHADRKLTEVPYSEEAARYFYDTLLGLCALCERVDRVFGKRENVIRAIETRNRPFELTDSKTAG